MIAVHRCRNVLAHALLFAAAASATACGALRMAKLDLGHTPATVEERHGVTFDVRHRLALDVYRPRHEQGAPVVVFFYGGDWTQGERGWYRFVGDALAAHGIVAVIPDYRKVPDVTPDGFMADAARAVAWTRTHVAAFGGDPGRIFVMGHSAGGHIAALLATDPHWLEGVGLEPRDLAGCIGLAGVYLFLPADIEDDGMLAVFGDDGPAQDQTMPLTFVHGVEPPALLLHGLDDDEVDPDNSRLFATALHDSGDDAELRLYRGVDHSQLLLELASAPHDSAVLDDVLAFVRAHPHDAEPVVAAPPG